MTFEKKKTEDFWYTSKKVTGVGPEDRELRQFFEEGATVKCPNGHTIEVRTHLVINHRREIVVVHCPECWKAGKLSHHGSFFVKKL